MLNRLIYFLVIFFVAALSWYFVSIQPVTRQKIGAQEFEIVSGSSLNQILNSLSAQKLIRSRTAFKVTVIRLGVQNKLQAGYFMISPSMRADEIAKTLTKSRTKQVRVTIPEGLRSEEINQILTKAFANIDDSNYSSKEFSALTSNKEGILFPDTYDFELTASTSAIVDRLTNKYHTVAGELNIKPETEDRVLVIASLLEREAATSEEMPVIAGVIEKRLANTWPLQIDATVQYALASKQCKKLDCQWWKPNLTSDDLKIDSPYNTYKNQGLPPKAISNPGKDALSAANNPVATSAWFYLHDASGQIRYADTIEKHNQNVCIYLRKDCN